MFSYDKLAEISYFAEHTLPPQSTRKTTIDEEMKNENIQSLNGYWQFSYATNPQNTLPVDHFFSEDLNLDGLAIIKVPGHIQLQGYDRPQYVNTQYPWDGSAPLSPGEVRKDYNPVGTYLLEFDVTLTLLDRHILDFLGAESALAVWLNGVYVGYSEDSFSQSSFDVTDLLKPTNNRLVVQVFKYCSGSWLEDQDFWRFSGLFRDVILRSQRHGASTDLTITTTLSNNYTKGTLSLAVPFSSQTPKQIRISFAGVDYTITGSEALSFSCEVDNVALWSAEQPNLYPLQLKVYQENGVDLIECIETLVGFVEYKLQDGIYYVNGKRIVFNGVNRHEWSPLTGRTVTEQDMRADLILMKQHNINAIRTSHYPNHPTFYKLCEEIGFYVINEVNLETHGAWLAIDPKHPQKTFPQDAVFYYPGEEERVRKPLLTRAENLYQRDKNCACVCMWSCGNESLGGSVIQQLAQYFHAQDPNRIVHYEGEFFDRSKPISDVESRMYDRIDHVVEWLEEGHQKPFLYCEYAHAMGNSVGNLDKYQALTRKYPHYQGGFIWEYKDHGLLVDGRYHYGGDSYDRPCDYNFVCDGLVLPDNTPTPKLRHVKYVYQPFVIEIGSDIKITNEYLFTDLNAFDVILTTNFASQTKDRQVLSCDCPPGNQVSLPVSDGATDVLVEILVPARQALPHQTRASMLPPGHLIAYGQKVYPIEMPRPQKHRPVTMVQGNQNIGMQCGPMRLLFSQTVGLNSIRHGEQELLKDPVRVNVGRALIDNDRGALLGFSHGPLLHVSTQQRMHSEVVGNRVRVRHFFGGNPDLYCDVFYGFYDTDELEIEVDYKGFDWGNRQTDFLDFGLMFHLNPIYRYVTYTGNGPDENYCDRNSSSLFGTYSFAVEDNVTPYLYPQECGNRTNVTECSISDGIKTLCATAIDTSLEFSALPYTMMQLHQATHQEELQKIGVTAWRISHRHGGIGGDDSWGARPHPEFLIDSNQPLRYRFTLQIK